MQVAVARVPEGADTDVLLVCRSQCFFSRTARSGRAAPPRRTHPCSGVPDLIASRNAPRAFQMLSLRSSVSASSTSFAPRESARSVSTATRGLQRVRARAVQPHQKVRIRAGIGKLLTQIGFRAGDDLALHELHSRRLAAAGKHRGHGPDAFVQIVKRDEQGEVHLRLGDQLHRELREKAQRAFAADHEVEQGCSRWRS